MQDAVNYSPQQKEALQMYGQRKRPSVTCVQAKSCGSQEDVTCRMPSATPRSRRKPC